MPVNIDLSSTDAWDDSALVDTWNQALREYKVPSIELSSRVRLLLTSIEIS